MQAPQRILATPGRQIWRHGPIELVIDVWGEPAALERAHAAAWVRFQTVLAELVAELPLLRQPVETVPRAHGAIARRMEAACRPLLPVFITPMAAVAGSVAEAIVAFYSGVGIARASVNNGGDIALHLAPGEVLRVGLVADIHAPRLDGEIAIDAAMPVRGIATSGWRGRSQSLGIADAVTVLAPSAAAADAAATLIANAVDVDHPAVRRAPACTVKDDSDLGERLVTVAVGPLPEAAVEAALSNGEREARRLAVRGLVTGAALALQGRWRTIGEATFELPSGGCEPVSTRLLAA